MSEFDKTVAAHPYGAGYARCVPSASIPTSPNETATDLLAFLTGPP